MPGYTGETAGLLTSLFFAINSIFITKAGQQVGAVVSNQRRVIFALLYLAVLNTILYGQPPAKPRGWYSRGRGYTVTFHPCLSRSLSVGKGSDKFNNQVSH